MAAPEDFIGTKSSQSCGEHGRDNTWADPRINLGPELKMDLVLRMCAFLSVTAGA